MIHQETNGTVSLIGRAQSSMNHGLDIGVASITTGPINSLEGFQFLIFITLNSAGSKILVLKRGSLSPTGHNNVSITLEIETTILDSPGYMTAGKKKNELL